MQEMDEEAISLGQMLRQARESKGMSVEDVADELHISAAKIKLIENDECDLQAQDAVFMRGYIRSYARLVKLSEDEVGDIFQELGLVTPKKQHQQREIKIKEISSKDKPVRLITNLVIIILIILVLIWWYSHFIANNNTVTQPPAVSEISAQPVSDASANADVNVQASTAEQPQKSAEPQKLAESQQPTEQLQESKAPADKKSLLDEQTVSAWINPDLPVKKSES